MKIVKKLVSLLASSVLVLLVSSFLSLQPIEDAPFGRITGLASLRLGLGDSPAFANDNSERKCQDIEHVEGRTSTEAGPSGDSGVFNFDIPGTHGWQACGEDDPQDWTITQPAAQTESGRFLRGWAWNTNLGDISFYCKDGKNFAPGCGGTVNYGTVILPDGRVRGFAWGDNIGWISMGCYGGSNLGVPCGGTNYGVKIAQFDGEGGDATLKKGHLYGYAWTNSVGYMNFRGVKIGLAREFEACVLGDLACPAPPDTAYLTVQKQVANDNGGTLAPDDFELTIDGNPAANGTMYPVTIGTHAVSETNKAGYSPSSWGGDCSASGNIILGAGESKTCVITNDDIPSGPLPGTLTVLKIVVHNDGGAKSASDFALFINEVAVQSGLPKSLAAGTYTVSEINDPAKYKFLGFGGDCAADGTVTLAAGEHKACTLINDDVKGAEPAPPPPVTPPAPPPPPACAEGTCSTLTVIKAVLNNDRGIANTSDFPLFVNREPVMSEQPMLLPPGTYTVTETNREGYKSLGWAGDCNADGKVTVVEDQNKVCIITNDDIPPSGSGSDGGSGGGGGVPPLPDNFTFDGAEEDLLPAANGSDAHPIIIQVLRNGVPVDAALEDGRFEVAQILWNTTLRADQVTRCNEVEGLADRTITTPCTFNGAILPTSSDFKWDNSYKGYVGYVRAIAPTNNTGTGPHDKIKLTELKVSIDGYTENAISASREFKFKRPIQVKMWDEQISAIREKSTPTRIYTKKHPGKAIPPDQQISIKNQLHGCSDTYEFLYDSGLPGGAVNTVTGERIELHSVPSDGEVRKNIDRTFVSGDPHAPCTFKHEEQTLDDVDNAPLTDFYKDYSINSLVGMLTRYIYTYTDGTPTSSTEDSAVGYRPRVEYTTMPLPDVEPADVRYFATTTPDSSILNQSADIRGDVRTDVQKELLEGASKGSIGEFSQSKRKLYVEEIARQTKILPSETPANNIAVIDGMGTWKPIRYFKRAPNFSTPCQIKLDKEGKDVAFDKGKDTTIVAVGCDVYINDNIFDYTFGRSKSGRLGIIALEDFTIQNSERRGGNVYICNKVTDLEANIVADSAIFPYGISETDCGDPDRGDVIDLETGLPKVHPSPREAGKRQLTIVGSITSNNTVGGSLSNPPVLGDGTATDDLFKARLYDLNFLRYAKTTARPNGDVTDKCWDQSVQLSKRLLPNDYKNTDPPYTEDKELLAVCTENNPEIRGIVNIIYRSSGGLPIFKGIK